LKNICIDLGELKAAIIIRKGCTLNMTDCKIYVNDVNKSSVKWGVVVMPDAKLVFNNTVFQGLGTGLFTYRASEIILNKCRFENCYEGVMVRSCIYTFHVF
jgi:nitrous oxidase accessory protein NosD